LRGYAPWWVLLETRGRRTGKPRTTPLARGPLEGNVLSLVAVHGRHANWVRNIEAHAGTRIKLSGRWYKGRAAVHDYHEATAHRFNPYARCGPKTLGIDPAVVRIEITREDHSQVSTRSTG
jgi:deazaflavin-dependent oxidoreductase (nitroreductase family)